MPDIGVVRSKQKGFYDIVRFSDRPGPMTSCYPLSHISHGDSIMLVDMRGVNVYPPGVFHLPVTRFMNHFSIPEDHFSANDRLFRFTDYYDKSALLSDLGNLVDPIIRPGMVVIESKDIGDSIRGLIGSIKRTDPSIKILYSPALISSVNEGRWIDDDALVESMPWYGKELVSYCDKRHCHGSGLLSSFSWDLISLGVDGFVDAFTPSSQFGMIRWKRPFMDYITSSRSPSLYIFVGPTGFGKSTIVDELRYLGFKLFPNLTTREYRSLEEERAGSLLQVSSKEFKEFQRSGDLVGVRNRYGDSYGFSMSRLESLLKCDNDLVVDCANIGAALEVRSVFPDRVRIVGLDPSVDPDFGLEARKRHLIEPKCPYASSLEEFEDIRRRQAALIDTRRRKDSLPGELDIFFRNIWQCDLVVKGVDLRKNIASILDYARGVGSRGHKSLLYAPLSF